MIDLEKEEFLRRLDIRLSAISGMLAYHEKHIASSLCKPEQFRDVVRNIDKAQRDIVTYITETDEKIREDFGQLKRGTNFGRIKSMSVDQLADFICDIYSSNEHREIRVDGKWMHPEDVEEWLEKLTTSTED